MLWWQQVILYRIEVGKATVEKEETAQLGHKRANLEAVPAAETIHNYKSRRLNPFPDACPSHIYTYRLVQLLYPQDQDKEPTGPPNPIERPMSATQGDLDILF